jgi:hypothetical protein
LIPGFFQVIALILVIAGSIAMKMRLGKFKKYKLRTHDTILTFSYLLMILSLPRMLSFAYYSIASGNVSPLILIHGLIGIVVVVVGFIFVINKGSLKIKREWKKRKNMQTLAILWILNFILGSYLVASLFSR